MPSLLTILMLMLQAPPETNWRFDEVRLRNGATFRGLILQEATEVVVFQVVFRQPGRPTMTLRTTFNRREIDNVTKLKDPERAALKDKLAELDQSGDGERRRMEALELTRVPWLGQANAAWQYRSERFVLISGTSEELTRRVAVRLEQLHAVFVRYFPSKNANAKPITIQLAGRIEDYRQLLGPNLSQVQNPAIYDPAAHRIVCGTDLRKLSDDIQAAKAKHKSEREKLDQYEADIRLLYKQSKPELERYLSLVSKERERLRTADRANDTAFQRSTERLFALVYHETFHAYLAEHVYPGQTTLPRWVNEGLAQVYETAVVEAGELRVGHPDATRLAEFQKLIQKTDAPKLADLLRAKPDEFLAGHASQKAASSQKYLMAWAVMYYLMFERGLVGGPEFEAFVTVSGEPLAGFTRWTNQEIDTFEKQMLDYFTRLKHDGLLTPKK
ncbi:MAG: DUF1570 domain-containing protein [Fimbriiglobus sp.]